MVINVSTYCRSARLGAEQRTAACAPPHRHVHTAGKPPRRVRCQGSYFVAVLAQSRQSSQGKAESIQQDGIHEYIPCLNLGH